MRSASASVLTEYQKAPQVTRDRMYTDTMQQIYSNTTKVLVDSSRARTCCYLPLDKLMQMTGQARPARRSMPPAPSRAGAAVRCCRRPRIRRGDARARDGRSRDRDAPLSEEEQDMNRIGFIVTSRSWWRSRC